MLQVSLLLACCASSVAAPPPPPPPPTCAVAVEEGEAYEGGCKNIEQHNNIPSAKQCCSICFSSPDPQVAAFTWQDSTGVSPQQCKCKSSGGQMVKKKGHISAVRDAPSPPSPPPPPTPGPPAPAPVPPNPPPPPPGPQPRPPADQNNIVFVLTDDQDALLNGYVTNSPHPLRFLLTREH